MSGEYEDRELHAESHAKLHRERQAVVQRTFDKMTRALERVATVVDVIRILRELDREGRRGSDLHASSLVRRPVIVSTKIRK